MSLDSTEEEQIDQIKQFFRENGLFMLIAVILVVGGNIGYDYYETSERTTAEAASLDFSNFQKAVDEVVATGSGAVVGAGAGASGIGIGSSVSVEVD